VWGPARSTVHGEKDYVSFVDAYNRFTWICLLRQKSDVFAVFHRFQPKVERSLDRKIKTIQTDLGGGGVEYQKLDSFFNSICIVRRVSCRHTHQQNCSVEHKHRHIVETGLALLAHSAVPLHF
jgi:hypothetical protein